MSRSARFTAKRRRAARSAILAMIADEASMPLWIHREDLIGALAAIEAMGPYEPLPDELDPVLMNKINEMGNDGSSDDND